jgi:long-subunit fatty acid transport protein
MKRAGIIIAFVFTTLLTGYTQNVDDALRYSQIFYGGTARFMSMGGAFTALGGDLSSLSLNPAGTGVFRSSEFSITPQMFYNNTTARFMGNSLSDFKYNFNLNQLGFATNIISKDNETGLINLNFAYSFNKTNNFFTNTSIEGISKNSSMADFWANSANGTLKRDLSGAVLNANLVYLIDTISGSSNTYATVFSSYGDNTGSTYGQTIRRIITNEGYSGEHAFSIGSNYSNKYFFGATIGVSRINYTGHYEHLEADYDNVIFDFKNFTYTDHFEASGTGYSLKLGTIIKPVEMLRIGLAFHSPVIYRLHEYFYNNIVASFDTKDSNGDDTYEASQTPSRYNYTLTTPFRVLAGVAVQVKKLALLSADYELVDYSMARLSKGSDGYNFFDENKGIQNILKSASNLRFGAEFRLNTLYLRGGYSYYGKAFKVGEDNEKTNYQGPSFGIGFRQPNFYFDMAYSILTSSQKYYMYFDPGYLEPTTIHSAKNAFTATIGFRF